MTTPNIAAIPLTSGDMPDFIVNDKDMNKIGLKFTFQKNWSVVSDMRPCMRQMCEPGRKRLNCLGTDPFVFLAEIKRGETMKAEGSHRDNSLRVPHLSTLHDGSIYVVTGV